MDNEKRYDVEAVKTRLFDYREIAKDIEALSERIERLKTKIIGLGAQNLTDMPKSPSPATDRLTDLLQQKAELEESIQEYIARQKSERQFFENIIRHLRRSDERSVIRVRYLDGASWNDVVDVLFGGKEDFLEKEDIYLRRVYKLHGQALLAMAKYIEDNGLNSKNASV